MPTGARKPDVTIKARIGKTYDAKQRGGTLIEFHIPFAEWGKLQEIVLREASRGFGFKNGSVVLSLFRPHAEASLAPGNVTLVRRGARVRKRSSK